MCFCWFFWLIYSFRTRLIQQIVPDSGQQNPQTLAQQVEQSVYNSVIKVSGSRVGLVYLFGNVL